jgi:hypothetical protein
VNTLVSDPNGPTGSPDVYGTLATARNEVFGSEVGAASSDNLGPPVQPNPAPATATCSDGAGGTVLACSKASTQSGNNFTAYDWLLFLDLLIAAVFGRAKPSGSDGGFPVPVGPGDHPGRTG